MNALYEKLKGLGTLGVNDVVNSSNTTNIELNQDTLLQYAIDKVRRDEAIEAARKWLIHISSSTILSMLTSRYNYAIKFNQFIPISIQCIELYNREELLQCLTEFMADDILCLIKEDSLKGDEKQQGEGGGDEKQQGERGGDEKQQGEGGGYEKLQGEGGARIVGGSEMGSEQDVDLFTRLMEKYENEGGGETVLLTPWSDHIRMAVTVTVIIYVTVMLFIVYGVKGVWSVDSQGEL